MPFFDLPLAELEQYRPAVGEPADFDEFWQRTLDEARRHPAEPTLARVDSPLTAVEVHDVTFNGYAGQPVKAWLVLPTHRDGRLPAVVEYIGYGGGRGLPHEHLRWAASGYAHLVMDTRGQGGGWGTGGGTGDPDGTGPSTPGFMTRGIESPETYYYRRVFTDAVRAVDAVRTLDAVDPTRVAVTGVSQGGGIAVAAAGLSDGLIGAMPDVPFLQNFERAVGLTDAFPYQEIVTFLSVQRDAPARTFATLAYFDGVNFARRASAPALFSTALHDQTCPPSTVFATKNHWAADADIEVYPFNQHEGGQARHWVEQAAWLAARV